MLVSSINIYLTLLSLSPNFQCALPHTQNPLMLFQGNNPVVPPLSESRMKRTLDPHFASLGLEHYNVKFMKRQCLAQSKFIMISNQRE